MRALLPRDPREVAVWNVLCPRDQPPNGTNRLPKAKLAGRRAESVLQELTDRDVRGSLGSGDWFDVFGPALDFQVRCDACENERSTFWQPISNRSIAKYVYFGRLWAFYPLNNFELDGVAFA